jgi:hypothetical protein
LNQSSQTSHSWLWNRRRTAMLLIVAVTVLAILALQKRQPQIPGSGASVGGSQVNPSLQTGTQPDGNSRSTPSAWATWGKAREPADFLAPLGSVPFEGEPAGLPPYPGPEARRDTGFRRQIDAPSDTRHPSVRDSGGMSGAQSGGQSGGEVEEIVYWNLKGVSAEQAMNFYTAAAGRAGFTALPAGPSLGLAAPKPTATAPRTPQNPPTLNRTFIRDDPNGPRLGQVLIVRASLLADGATRIMLWFRYPINP